MNAVRSIAALVAYAALNAPVSADDSATIKDKLAAAQTRVSSFVMTMHITGTTGITTTMTFVRPQSMRSETNLGATTIVTYFVDGTLYIRLPSGSWQKSSLSAMRTQQMSMNIAEGLSADTVTLLPDRRENGVLLGALELQTQLPPNVNAFVAPGGQRLTCTYDKTSFLMTGCSNTTTVTAFSKYNDPSNVVELPAEALSATPLVLPSMGIGNPAEPAASAAPSSVPQPVPSNTPQPVPSNTPQR